MIDVRGNVFVRDPKRRKFLNDRDVCEIEVSKEHYDAAISLIVVANYCNLQD